MNLSKESFPAEDSFKRISDKSIPNCSSTSESSSPSEFCCDYKPTHNTSRELRPGKLKIPIFKQKAHSYQDLHTDYTKRRYQHVKSKVKEYIANLKSLDRPKHENKIYRHRSLPETVSDFAETNLDELKFNADETIQMILQEKDKQIEELRELNQNLEDKFQEKCTMLARLKLNADIMRIEFLQMKEKQRRLSIPNTEYSRFYQRGSLSHTGFYYEQNNDFVKSTATQTEFEDFNDSESFNEYYQEMDDCVLRRRSFSSSMRCENECEIHRSLNSDRKELVESESEISLESHSDVEKRQLSITDDKLVDSNRRISWPRRIVKPCRKVLLCCSQIPEVENDFIYTKLPIEEIPLSSSL